MSIVELFDETERTLENLKSSLALDPSKPLPSQVAEEAEDVSSDWVRPQEMETLLLQINRAITSTLPLDEVIRLVLDNIIQLTQTDRGFLMLREGVRGRLRFVVARDREKQTLAGTDFDISQGFVQKTLRSRKILYLEDALRDRHFRRHQSIFHLALRTIICAPLQLGDRIIGVIYADSRRRANRFNEKKLELIKLFVSQAAVAIENARLFRESQRSEEKYRTLVETAQDIILSFDTEGGLLYANPALRHILGRTSEELGSLRGKLGWIHPGDRKRMRECFLKALEGAEVQGVEFRGRHRDGGVKWLSISLQPVRGSGRHRLSGVQGVVRDITAQREFYLRMSQDDKIRALGEMAGGVAHDFNNILGVIIPRMQLLAGRASSEEDRRDCRLVEKAARDGERIVRRIQEFTRSHQTGGEMAETDLNRVIREAIELTRPRWERPGGPRASGSGYRIRTSLQARARLLGSEAELGEMFTNILFNALDAMPEGGEIRIRTWAREGRLYCSIRDGGMGMGEEVQKRAFDPFFTTKGRRGMGLGLSVVYGIVSRHQGQIEIDSEPGKGTTFTINLPALSSPEDGPQPVPGTKTGETPGSRVLVVDDDEGIRQVLTEILENFGHQVTAVRSGREALARMEKEEFQIVLTDLELSGMSGWEVARACRGLQPKSKVVLLTGWGIDLPEEEIRLSGVDCVLSKPIVMEQIRRTLASLVGGDV